MLQAHDKPAFRSKLIHESQTGSVNLSTRTLFGEHYPDRPRDILYVEWRISRRDLGILERGRIEWERVETSVKRLNAAVEVGRVQQVAAVGERPDGNPGVDRSRRGHLDN